MQSATAASRPETGFYRVHAGRRPAAEATYPKAVTMIRRIVALSTIAMSSLAFSAPVDAAPTNIDCGDGNAEYFGVGEFAIEPSLVLEQNGAPSPYQQVDDSRFAADQAGYEAWVAASVPGTDFVQDGSWPVLVGRTWAEGFHRMYVWSRCLPNPTATTTTTPTTTTTTTTVPSPTTTPPATTPTTPTTSIPRDPGGDTATTTSTTEPARYELAVTKTIDNNPDSATEPGITVDPGLTVVSYTITNTGNQPLDITVTDTEVDPWNISCSPPSTGIDQVELALLAGQTANCAALLNVPAETGWEHHGTVTVTAPTHDLTVTATAHATLDPATIPSTTSTLVPAPDDAAERPDDAVKRPDYSGRPATTPGTTPSLWAPGPTTTNLPVTVGELPTVGSTHNSIIITAAVILALGIAMSSIANRSSRRAA